MKCKVIGCNNSVLEIKDNVRHEDMKNTYGYCQIHNIDGLVVEDGIRCLFCNNLLPYKGFCSKKCHDKFYGVLE